MSEALEQHGRDLALLGRLASLDSLDDILLSQGAIQLIVPFEKDISLLSIAIDIGGGMMSAGTIPIVRTSLP